MARIFLSYSRDDAELAADSLRAKLNQANHIVWRDREEICGESGDWQRQVRAAIESAHGVIVLLTPQGVMSEFVRYEWQTALHLGKRVILVGVAPCEVPDDLGHLPIYNAANRESYQNMLVQLLRDLTELDVRRVEAQQIAGEVSDELVAYIRAGVRAYNRALKDEYQSGVRSEPAEPYKGLYAYELGDEKIFFGRDMDARLLQRAVIHERFTVLHARSGAGKTSLINAGLMPLLIQGGYLPVCARVHTSPVESIKRAIMSALPQRPPAEFSALSLHHFLRIAEDVLGGESREIVIILDQFEEFFVLFPQYEQRAAFLNALADCYDDWTLRVRWVISLRKDFFSDLAELQDWLLTPFDNNFLLRNLTREQAMVAITAPVEAVAAPVKYEEALLTQMLTDLEQSGMELPHLQVICSQLFAQRAPDQAVITLGDYERMGQAQGILGGYLVKTLGYFSPEDRELAQRMLIELVSSQSTKRVLSRDDLIAAAHAPAAQVDEVLERLLGARLLRRDKDTEEGQVLYEMAHEYLVEEISNWFDTEITSRKQIEEMLQRAVVDWRVHDILMSLDMLERVMQTSKNLGDLTDDVLTCILLSSIQERYEVRYWMTRDPDRTLRLLEPFIHMTPRHRLRRQIIVSLRYLRAASVPFLIQRLEMPDEELRKVISQVLEHINTPQALAAAQQVWHEDDTTPDQEPAALDAESEREPGSMAQQSGNDVNLASPFTVLRLEAVDLLARQGGDEAIAALVDCLQDPSLFVRKAAAQALGKIGDTTVIPALHKALNDQSRTVRRAVADAIETISSSKVPKDEMLEFDEAGADDGTPWREAPSRRQEAAEEAPAVAEVDEAPAGEPEHMPYMVYSMGRPPILPEEVPETQKRRVVQAREERRRRLLQASDPKVWQRRVLATYQRTTMTFDAATIEAVALQLGRLPSFSRRAKAVEELRRLGAAAIPGLLVYLHYPQRIVRESVVGILDRLGWRPLDVESKVQYYMASGQWQESVALGQAAVPPLIRLLDSVSDVILRDVFFALKSLRDPSAVPALAEQLVDKTRIWIGLDETSADELAADVLEHIGTPEALAAVQSWRQAS